MRGTEINNPSHWTGAMVRDENALKERNAKVFAVPALYPNIPGSNGQAAEFSLPTRTPVDDYVVERFRALHDFTSASVYCSTSLMDKEVQSEVFRVMGPLFAKELSTITAPRPRGSQPSKKRKLSVARIAELSELKRPIKNDNDEEEGEMPTNEEGEEVEEEDEAAALDSDAEDDAGDYVADYVDDDYEAFDEEDGE